MPWSRNQRPPGSVPLDIEHRMRGGKRVGYSGGGYGDGEGGGGAGGGTLFRVALPSVEKPPGASDFNMFGTLAGQTTATTTPPALLASFQVPPNSVAVIRSVSILANALLVTSDIEWQLRFNGVAVQGWDALTINPRAAGSVEVSWTPDETYIRVPEGALVEWFVRVLDGGTYQLSIGAHGWFYGSALDVLAQRAYARGL